MTTNTEAEKEWEKEHLRVQRLKADMKEFDDDPDWLRVRHELERKTELADPNYWVKRNIESIETTLRYGLPGVKLVLWVIASLLGLILWRVWD